MCQCAIIGLGESLKNTLSEHLKGRADCNVKRRKTKLKAGIGHDGVGNDDGSVCVGDDDVSGDHIPK